jgi:transcriptional regulator with XRE-family HTH domain
MPNFGDIGRRLREQRERAGLPVDEVASQLGISRALLYRYESGQVVKIGTLEKLAKLYGTTATVLLGLGNEYLTDGISFFERLLRCEEEADHITTAFGPIAFVLTSESYEQALQKALEEADEAGEALSNAEIQRLMRTLRARKETFARRRPGFVNIVPTADVERYLSFGLALRHDMPYAERATRRRAAAREVERIAALISNPPMGVQIALTKRHVPTSGFQILRSKERRLLINSPFRLGEPLNLRYGVAMISGEEVALGLHERLAASLWESGLTGAKALDEIQRLLKASR